MIKVVVWDCHGDKSMRLDEFNFTFIKACWYVIKEDVILSISEFHSHGSIPTSGNTSFLALIPKKENPQELSEYILLLGAFIKLLMNF